MQPEKQEKPYSNPKDGPKNNQPFSKAKSEGRREARPGKSARHLSVDPKMAKPRFGGDLPIVTQQTMRKHTM